MAQPKLIPVAECLVSTRPRRTSCRRCGAEIFACYVLGTPRALDTYRVDLLGEALALIAGQSTYTIAVIGRDRAIRRNTGMIARGLPRYGHLYVGHRCGLTWAAHSDARNIFPSHQDTECPF